MEGFWVIKTDLVPYKELELIEGKFYEIKMAVEFPEKYESRFSYTINNLNRMFCTGHPIVVVSPDRILSECELEDYRKFFCTYSKKVKKNMIYFPGPVVIKEVKR